MLVKELMKELAKMDKDSHVLVESIGGYRSISQVDADETINNAEDGYVEARELLSSYKDLEKMEEEFPRQALDFFSVTILS